jgi:DNA-directed RNA polymerase subunit RPC12/RpoP
MKLKNKNAKEAILIWVCVRCDNGVFHPAIHENKYWIEVCSTCGQRYMFKGGDNYVSAR